MLIGGAEGDRTPDLRIANAALCQTELLPHTGRREYNFKFQVSSYHPDVHFKVDSTDKQIHRRSDSFNQRLGQLVNDWAN